MAVRTQPTLLCGISARVTEAMTLSPSLFRKRYRSSYETPSSSASPASSSTLPLRIRYRRTSESILDIETEGVRGQAADEPLGLGYRAARHRVLELAKGYPFVPHGRTQWTVQFTRVFECVMPPVRTPVQTRASPEWSSCSLPVSPTSLIVPSPVASPAPAIALDALPPTLFGGETSSSCMLDQERSKRRFTPNNLALRAWNRGMSRLLLLLVPYGNWFWPMRFRQDRQTPKEKLYGRLGKVNTSAEVLKKLLEVVNVVRVKVNAVVVAAKLPILNPSEFDVWKMRIEQYFLMTNYSLWEVILNGDSPSPTRIVDGDVQIISPTTTEQSVSAASFKATVSTLPNVDSLSDAVIYSFFCKEIDLKWQIVMLTIRARRFFKRTGRNIGANGTYTIGFDMSKVECYNCHRRGHFARECRSPRDKRNKDTPSRTVPVEVPTSNALVSQCDAVGGYDWSFQADEEPTNYALMAYASSGSSSSSGYDNEVAPCSKACLESVEARLVVYQQNENVFEEDYKLLKLDVMLRDNALVELRKKFEKAEKERDDLKLTLEKFQTSSKNLSKLLESQVSDKIGLGYDSQVFNSQVFDCEELHSHELDNSVPKSPENDMHKTSEGYHAVSPPYTGTFMPPKHDLVFNDAPTASEPDAPIIEDWISDFEDETENKSVPKQKEPSFVPTSGHVKTHRESVKKVKHPKQAGNLRTNNQKSRDLEEINRGYVAFGGNPKGGKISGKGKIKTGKLDFDDVYFVNELKFNLFSLSQMCDKKNSVLFTDTECVVLSFGYKLPDENHVLLRVPRENNMYNVDLKNVVPSEDLTYLFANATLDESNLWHRRVLVTKPHNKTPYEVLLGRSPSIGFMRPFGCPVTILNTLDLLEKFDEKEILHINFLENKPNVAGIGPKWLFDIDTLTKSMNYQQVVVGNQPNDNTCIKENLDAGKVVKETVSVQQYLLLPLWSIGSQDPHNTYADAAFDVKENENDVQVSTHGSDKTDNTKHDEKDKRGHKGKSHIDSPTGVRNLIFEFEEFSSNNTNMVNDVSAPITAAGLNPTNITNSFNTDSPSDTVVSPNFEIVRKSSFVDPSKYLDDPDMPELEDVVYSDAKEDVGVEAVLSNLETNISVSSIPTTRVHKDHPVIQIIDDLTSAPQTRSMTRMEEGIDYDEVFSPVARIEAIQLFLADASFMGFMVYKEVKALYGLHQAPRAWYETLANYLLENGFQRGKIDQTLFIKKQKSDILLVQVYVDDIIFRSTNKELCKAFERLMKDKFQMSSIGELNFFLGLQVRQKDNGIFISQDKYVAKILRKFDFIDVKSASTPIETEKPLLKDPDGEDVDVNIYRSMIVSLMYLTSSRPDIMFAFCACARFQVTPKVSHLHAVKRIFRYLKGKLHLGLWYPKDSPFNLVAYSDSDYAGASFDRKSTTEGVNTPRCDEDIIELMELMVFMATTTIKKVNDVVQLRVLIDGKKVVISEDVIKSDVHLDDADGVECLPNEEIFAELARMGYEKPPPKLTFYKACSMASAVICLATEEEEVEMPTAPTPPYPTNAPSSPPQDLTPTPHATPPASPHRNNLLHLLNLLYSQAKEEVKEVRKEKEIQGFRVQEAKKGEKIEATNADKDITLVDVDTQEEVAKMDAKLQGRIDQDDKVNAASKGATAVEPTVFDDEEVTMTMAQILIKMKAKKATLLDEQIAQKLKYQSLKKKPVSIAQAKKNMIIYLKNMAGYKMKHFRGMTYDKVRPIFKREYKKVQTFFKPDKDIEEPKKKRVTEETLLQESFKKLKAVKVLGSESTQETPSNDPKEMSEEDVQNILEIIPMSEFKVEALQVKYPIIDWEIHNKGLRTYWKTIRVGGITEAYQSFEDMLKGFDREDMVALWNLVKEKFSSVVPRKDKEKALWVELTRLFEPNADDVF
nr:putative ribonuclease H-like domain-containing protein [Tanacetum cinerariifolium]